MKRGIVLLLTVLTILGTSAKAGVPDNGGIYSDPFKIRCTYYTYTGSKTSSGRPTVDGLTLAGKAEWKGSACYMWSSDKDGNIGDFIGIFEFTDTGNGANNSIIDGRVIDKYFSTDELGREWVKKYGDYVYIQIVPAVG